MEDAARLLRRPAAWSPLAISSMALALVLGYAALVGTGAPAGTHDERAPARIFQLLMAFDVLLIGVFAVRWLPRAPRSAAAIALAQILLAAVPVAALVLLET
jgi:hypothetical protein